MNLRTMGEDSPHNPSAPLIKLTRRGTVLVLCGLFVVCAWTFALGVFVGRGTAPVKFDIEKLQKELAELRKAMIAREEQRYPVDSERKPTDPALGFYEDLRKPARTMTAPEATHQPEVAVTPEATPAPVAAAPAVPAEPVKSAQPPPPVSQDADGEKRFAFQVASMRDQASADQMVAALRKKGFDAYRAMGIVPDKGIYYRVRVGNVVEGKQLDALKRRLEKNGFSPILVNH